MNRRPTLTLPSWMLLHQGALLMRGGREGIMLLLLLVCTLPMLSAPLHTREGKGEGLRLTLDDCIAMARKQSVDAAVALGELKSAYWQWRSYKADLLPEVSFSATLPSYNKRYTSYQQADGGVSYVRNDYLGMDGGQHRGAIAGKGNGSEGGAHHLRHHQLAHHTPRAHTRPHRQLQLPRSTGTLLE